MSTTATAPAPISEADRELFLKGAASRFQELGIPPERANLLLGRQLNKMAVAEALHQPAFAAEIDRRATKIASVLAIARKTAAPASKG